MDKYQAIEIVYDLAKDHVEFCESLGMELPVESEAAETVRDQLLDLKHWSENE